MALVTLRMHKQRLLTQADTVCSLDSISTIHKQLGATFTLAQAGLPGSLLDLHKPLLETFETALAALRPLTVMLLTDVPTGCWVTISYGITKVLRYLK